MLEDKVVFDQYINLRLSPKHPPVPPYHEGKYLEHFFYDTYRSYQKMMGPVEKE